MYNEEENNDHRDLAQITDAGALRFFRFITEILYLLTYAVASQHDEIEALLYDTYSHHDENAACSHSGCCHAHSRSSQDPDSQTESVESQHGCVFCQFFDQYHVINCEFLLVSAETLAFLNGSLEPSVVFAAPLNPAARGPPRIA